MEKTTNNVKKENKQEVKSEQKRMKTNENANVSLENMQKIISHRPYYKKRSL